MVLPTEAFVWGSGGRALTEEEIAREREIAAQLLANGADMSPIGHWTQGAARLVQALGGVMRERRADAASADNASYNSDLIKALMGGGGSSEASSGSTTASAMPMPGAAGEMAASDPSSGGEQFATIAPRLIADLSRDFDLTPEQAAGIVGQLGHESAGFGTLQEVKPLVEGSRGGFGYAQWTGPRRRAYEEFASAQGLDPTSYDANYGFLRHELQNTPEGKALEAVRSAPDALTAGRAFTDQFLRPGIPGYESRDRWTQRALGAVGQPVEVAGGGGRMADFGELNPALLQALTDPRATPQTQRVAGLLYEQQQAQAAAAQKAALAEQQAAEALAQRQAVASQLGIDPSYATDDEVWKAATGAQFREQPNDIREYEYARSQGYPGTFAQYQQEQRRAGATSVTTNVGEGDKFYENLDKKNAETFAALSDGGMQARTRMGQINRLESVLSQSPQGAEAAVKQWLGDIGVKTDGLDAIQATRALLEKMVPEQRPPGSGPMSDADIVMFRNSLPRLINQPGGNQIILNTMRGIAQYEMQMGEIADLVADRAIDPKEGRKRMRELANPLDGLSDLLKNAPAGGMPKQSGGLPEGVTQEEWDAMTDSERRLFQ